jgi:hypothetical protein
VYAGISQHTVYFIVILHIVFIPENIVHIKFSPEKSLSRSVQAFLEHPDIDAPVYHVVIFGMSVRNRSKKSTGASWSCQ